MTENIVGFGKCIITNCGHPMSSTASLTRLYALISLFVFCPLLTGQTITFTDVTQTAGVDYVQHNYDEAPSANRQIFMTGGAAAADYDGDGNVDLFVTRLDAADILFRNNGDGTFSDVTAQAFPPFDLDYQTNGAQWGDIDNDGDPDLYVTSIESNRYHLFINDGNGQFTEQAVSRGIDLSGADLHFGQSSSFGDYDKDGYLDVHVTEWREDFQVPVGLPFNAKLFLNAGSANPGSFSDVTDAAGVNMEDVPFSDPINHPDRFEAQSFATRFTDLDRDGYPDLIISSDHGTSRLYWNNHDGTFLDGTVAGNVGTDKFGMGSTVGDYDNDGDLDWYVTSIYDDLPSAPFRDGNRLYVNNGDRTFTDMTDTAKIRDGHWGWGVCFADFDNDGDLDLAQTNGIDWPAPFFFGPSHGDFIADPCRFWVNDGNGIFGEVSSTTGFTDTRAGKGLLTFDYDNDGDVDVFIVNNGEHPVLYRNDGIGYGNWLKIRTEGTVSNRDGICAFITVTPDASQPDKIYCREVDGGSNFLGQNDRTVHFGVGSNSQLDEVKVEWPSGIVQIFCNVDINQTINVVEAVLGDVNLDGETNLLDVSPFIALLQTSSYQAEADLNSDGDVDLLDVAGFIKSLTF